MLHLLYCGLRISIMVEKDGSPRKTTQPSSRTYTSGVSEKYFSLTS